MHARESSKETPGLSTVLPSRFWKASQKPNIDHVSRCEGQAIVNQLPVSGLHIGQSRGGYKRKMKIHCAHQYTYRNVCAEYSTTNTSRYNKRELI